MNTDTNKNLSNELQNFCAEHLERFLWGLHGVPYTWGGKNPVMGLDCSGLIIYVLSRMGALDRGLDFTAQGLHDHYSKHPELVNPKAGALGTVAFYGKNTDSITHCSMYIDDTVMLEAVGDRRVLSTENAKFWVGSVGAYVQPSLRRRRMDLVAEFRPRFPWEIDVGTPDEVGNTDEKKSIDSGSGGGTGSGDALQADGMRKEK